MGLCYQSCGGCSKDIEPDPVQAEPIVDTTEVKGTPYVGPPPSEEAPKPESLFLPLGCCNDAAKRLEDCCCLEVLKKYAEMKKTLKPSKIAQLSSEDVILANCKNHNKYVGNFDAIDYPD